MISMSNEREILNKLKDCVVNLDFDNIKDVAREALEAKIPAYQAVSKGMAKGMDIVGQKFESKEYFLAELIVAGDVMKEGLTILEPHLKPNERQTSGKVVIGTVKGDLHDIGKNIVITLLNGAGYETIDVGIDVPAEKFVETVREQKPDILGLSTLLSTCHPELETVINALKDAGLRDAVKIVVGGATVTDTIAKNVGADRRAKDAVDGVNICNEWMRTKEKGS